MRRELGAAWALLGLVVLLSAATRAFGGGDFLSVGNLTNILAQVCVTAVLAAGASFVIFGGGIDLSIGSLLAVSAALAAGALKADWPVPLACAAGVLTGAAFGAANGVLVAWLGLPPFIATLGMMGIARGCTYVYLGGAPLFSFPASFRLLSEGRLAGIPAPVIVMGAVFGLGSLILARTRFGRAVYALGGNEEAARLSGIPVRRLKASLYVAGGAAAGLAGILLAARLDSAEPQAGDGYELDAIAAVVMGGASLSGGVGTIGGSLVGALIMGVVRNGLNLLNVSSHWQKVAIGGIILAAVLFDVMRRRRQS
ncbi:MAG: ABC transporter permease [Candidatus Coatesbacteria bacterium]